MTYLNLQIPFAVQSVPNALLTNTGYNVTKYNARSLVLVSNLGMGSFIPQKIYLRELSPLQGLMFHNSIVSTHIGQRLILNHTSQNVKIKVHRN